MPTTPLTADELRPFKEQALHFLAFARTQGATEIKAVVESDIDPKPVTYLIERQALGSYDEGNDFVPDGSFAEQITVKRGRGSGQQVLFGGPASWLEA